jgi:aspartyl-tRNA(Asn)/glutamyl-tRNA(Gln) amidotransferase subunit C
VALTSAEVEHVARLARLRLEPAELERMRDQLSNILDYIAMLQEVDVEGVPPTAQVTGLTSVMRPDTPAKPLSQEQALSNAPDRLAGMFRVKGVFDE